MKKIICIFIYVMCFLSIAHGQLSQLYSMSTSNKDVRCSIFFYIKGYYSLELSEAVTSDIINAYVLSFGKYSIFNDKDILLTDLLYNFSMNMELDKDTLRIKKSFTSLVNCDFIYYDANPYNELYMDNKPTAQSLQQKKEQYQLAHERQHYPFKPGIYDNEDYLIYIQRDKNYLLFFKNILISKGRWKRDGNEIILFDTTLSCHFYLAVGESVLISMLLPGDYKGIKLKKSNSINLIPPLMSDECCKHPDDLK